MQRKISEEEPACRKKKGPKRRYASVSAAAYLSQDTDIAVQAKEGGD